MQSEKLTYIARRACCWRQRRCGSWGHPPTPHSGTCPRCPSARPAEPLGWILTGTPGDRDRDKERTLGDIPT